MASWLTFTILTNDNIMMVLSMHSTVGQKYEPKDPVLLHQADFVSWGVPSLIFIGRAVLRWYERPGSVPPKMWFHMTKANSNTQYTMLSTISPSLGADPFKPWVHIWPEPRRLWAQRSVHRQLDPISLRWWSGRRRTWIPCKWSRLTSGKKQIRYVKTPQPSGGESCR